jgi:uncharacterized protein YggE
MAEATVSVRGEAIVRAEPDEALVWIEVSSVNASPAVALADVVRRSEAFVALLDELGIQAGDRSTTGIETHEEYEHRSNRPAGHRATARWVVRLRDAALVGPLVTRAGQEFEASISGPNWRISLDNPARLEAAKQAAASAQKKATAYAAGLNAELGQLLSLAEPHVHGPRRITELQSGGSAAAAAATGALPVEAGEHEAVAVIDATFALQLAG